MKIRSLRSSLPAFQNCSDPCAIPIPRVVCCNFQVSDMQRLFRAPVKQYEKTTPSGVAFALLRRVALLLGEANLLHEGLVVPVEPLFHHDAVFPASDCGHAQAEGAAIWLNGLSVRQLHGL